MAIDLQRVKDAAAGKWPDILTDVGGVDPASLDGRHGPCPQCGGKDRFRALDLASGALFCNRCFNQKNGDGLGAVGWLRGWTLPESIDAVASYLHLSSGNGSQPRNPGTSKNPGENGVVGFRGSPKTVKTYRTKAAAVEAVSRMIGQKPTGQWDYHDAAGQVVAAVLRYDLPNGDKTYRPVSLVGNGWAARGPEPPRPLYALHELGGAQRIFITEGEKAADAGRSVGLRCTTSMNGALAPGKSDWTPLAGRECILLPDNDEPGEEYINAAGAILGNLTPAPVVRVLRLPDLDTGEDLYDFLERRDATEPDGLRAMIDGMADDAPGWTPSTPESEPDAKGPTKAETQQRTPPATWRAFPTDCLPQPVRQFVEAGARAIGCDESFLAVPMLAALAGAVGNTRTIELKGSWREPSIVWSGIVSESGSAKSPALEMSLQFVRNRQRVTMQSFGERMAAHESEMLQYEKAIALWKRSQTSTEPPARPEPPTAERTWIDDVTIEAVAGLLASNPRGLLAAKDELSGWFAGFDRYSQGKGGDCSKWLECWSARPIVLDRKTGPNKTLYIPRPAVSVTGSIPIGPLRRALGVEHLDNGLFPRILWCCPPRRAKRWTDQTISWTVEQAMTSLFMRLYELEMTTGHDGQPEPIPLKLDDEARQVWVEHYNAHNEEAAGLSGQLASVWAKAEGYGARLALLVHLVRVATGCGSANPAMVDSQSITAGCVLAKWFAHETRRILGLLNETDEDETRRGLAELIGRLGGRCTPRDFRHHGFKGDAEAAENALAELVKAGYGRWEPVPPGASGGRPTRAFQLAGSYGTPPATGAK